MRLLLSLCQCFSQVFGAQVQVDITGSLNTGMRQ